jgi:SAM-dependent methyltransferase
MPGYAEDLAYIHDAGFSGFITEAAPGLLAMLRKHRIGGGNVVDLGCGSGRWAAMLGSAGYKVTGIDQSAAMIRMARKIAPAAKFHTASLWGAALPSCDAVTAIGECVNYTFDGERGLRDLRLLFRRAGHALRPGGLFVFDFATPLRIPRSAAGKELVQRRGLGGAGGNGRPAPNAGTQGDQLPAERQSLSAQ